MIKEREKVRSIAARCSSSLIGARGWVSARVRPALLSPPLSLSSDFITIIIYQYINCWISCIRNGRDGGGSKRRALSHFVRLITNSAENDLTTLLLSSPINSSIDERAIERAERVPVCVCVCV